MKSKPNPASLLKVLLSVAVGVAIGWWGRGMTTGTGSGPLETVPPAAEISRTDSRSTASPMSQSPTGVSAEKPSDVAHRLLQTVLEDSRDKGNDALLKFRFQQALAGCDEAAVSWLLDIMTRSEDAPVSFKYEHNSLPMECLLLLVARWASLNPRGAFDCQLGLVQAGVEFKPEDLSLVMALLSERDLVQVKSVIEGLPSGSDRVPMEIAWLQSRTKETPEEVFQFLMNLDGAGIATFSRFEKDMVDLFKKLATQDPSKALQAASLFPKERFLGLRLELLNGWFQLNPKTAEQWVLDQNDADMFNACYVSVWSSGSGVDEKFLRENFFAIKSADPKARASLAHNLAERLAEKDIPESIRWSATLPSVEQEAANRAIAYTWMKKDTQAAAQWLATWPAGESRDDPVFSLVTNLVEDDPREALSWAVSVQSKSRYLLMKITLDSLTVKDPAAAEREFQSLSEEDRTVLSVMRRHETEFK